MENDGKGALARLLALDVGEGGIEEIVRSGGDQAKGIAARQVGVLLGGLVRLGIAGQGIEAVRLHARRMELELAGRRREALGEGRRCYVEAHPPGFLEAFQGDALAPQVVAVEDGARQVVVAVEQAGLVEPQAPRQAAEHLGMGQAFAGRLDRRLVPVEVDVAVGVVEVGVLHLHGRGQHDIGIQRRVGGEVLGDHREQVLALQAPADLVLVGHAGRRVGAVDEQHLDRRIGDLEQPLAETRHGETTAFPGAQVVGPERRPVAREEATGVVAGAAAGMAPIAGDAGDTGDGAHRHAAAAVTLHAHGDADAGRPRRRQALAKGDDALFTDAGNGGDTGRRVFEDALAEGFPAHGVARQEVAVLGAPRHHDMQQAQRQGGVGAGNRRQVPVGLGRRARPDRVDDDDVGAALARRCDDPP